MNKKWIICLFFFFSLFLTGCDLIPPGPTGETCTITFEVNGGEILASVQVNEGSTIVLPTTTKEGFTFSGWYADEALSGSPLTQLTIINDITIYAKWTPLATDLLTIQFVTNGGSSVAPIQIASEQVAAEPTPPTKNGYQFGGWFLDSELSQSFSFATPVQDNITLYAKWNPDSVVICTIQFISNDGGAVDSIQVPQNSIATEPTPPTKNGYQFDGWFLDSELSQSFSFATPVQDNITLYAKWNPISVPMCTIQFASNEGSFVDPIQVPQNSITSAPTPPTRAKHQFLGWYLDPAFLYPFDFSEPITTHFTLYAKWSNPIIESFLITFEINGGDAIDAQYIIENYLLTKPIPTKIGFEFDNWYQDEGLTVLFDFEQPITQAHTLYAKWIPETYTIQFEVNDGTAVDTQSYFYDDAITLPSSTKAGYQFEGWYEDEELTIRFTATTMSNESFILYAKWITPISDFQYSVNNDEVTILSYQGSAAEITIPNFIDSKPVKHLAANAFAANQTIRKIVANNELTTIGSQAFANMPLLKELILQNNAQQIGEQILNQSLAIQFFQLSSELNHPLSYYIGTESALFNQSFVLKFSNNAASINPIIYESYLGEAILELADDHSATITSSLFQNNQYISHLSIPEGVNIISGYAFANMPLLKTIILPKSLTEIGSNIFENDPLLESITIPFIGKTRTSVNTEGNIGYLFSKTSYPGSYKILQFNGSTYDPTFNKGISSYISSSLKKLVITDASILPYGALHNATSLEELELNEGITAIGRYALSATGLKTIAVPGSITLIDRYGFANSSYLKNITFASDSSLSTIEDFAFYRCTSLKTVILPNGLTVIGEQSFAYCSALTTLFIPDSVTSIQIIPFKESNILTVYTSASEEAAGWYAFSQPIVFDIDSFHTNNQFLYAASLNEIIIMENLNPDGLVHLIIPAQIDSLPVKAIANYAFYNCETLQTLEFESSSVLESIGSYAFADCINLNPGAFPTTLMEFGDAAFAYTAISSLTVGNEVIWIGNKAFEGSLLENLTFETNSSLESIGESAFDGTLVTSIHLPKSVMEIGYRAFSFMPNLTTFTFEDDSLCNYIGDYAFYKSENLTSIVIPKGVTEIGMGTISFIPALTSCEFEEGSELISIYAMAFANTSLEQITIPAFVELIDDQAFMNCSNLQTVLFASDQAMQRIGISAFENCTVLQSINLPDSLTLLAGKAFKECRSLQTITLPTGLSAINTDTFYHANLTSVHIPNTITRIYPGAFLANSNLTTLTFESNSSLTQIDNAAFSGTNIKEVVLPKSLQVIGSNIIRPALEKLSFEEGSVISEIPNSAFYNSTQLKEVTFPDSVTTIGAYAFACTSSTLINSTYNYEMTKFFIPNTILEIDDYAFVNLMNVTIFVEEGAITTDWSTNWNVRTMDYFKKVLTRQPVYYGYQETKYDGDFEIVKTTAAIHIIGMNPTSSQTNLLIPAMIDALPVQSITSNAFMNNTVIESVLFEEYSTFQKIGINAFKNAANLRYIFFPDSLVTIDADAFRGCSSLHHIYLPAATQEIANTAFYELSNFRQYSAPSVAAMYHNNEYAYYLDENQQAVIVDALTPALRKDLIIPATVDDYTVSSFDKYFISNNPEIESIFINDDVSFNSLPIGFISSTPNLTKVYIPLTITVIETFGIGNAPNCVIYTAHSSLPSGWGWSWKDADIPVVFSANGFN
ncbi:MAG: leucine-rich repeat protein [Bacilli bacterium]|jgi:uncharacterized repeat protein (TIGR02543 family)|nr:leucine-rich repeat protein [Bacilli bacterium]